MPPIYFDNPKIIHENKARLEKELEVKIEIKGKDIIIEGKPENEFIAEKVVEALNLGFPLTKALQIKKENAMFEILPIKNFTKKSDLDRIRGRIIGTKGKTLRILTELTKCDFELKGNRVAIIGDSECFKLGEQAIKSLIQGTKTANVYAYLEKHHPIPIFDFGLKPKKESKRKKY